MRHGLAALAALLLTLAEPSWVAAQASGADPLPSWQDGAAKQAILGFVARVTKDGGPEFVPGPERIAVFDNDGTLWSEQPAYVQLAYALDRIKALAPKHPEWKEKQPFKGVLAGDLKAALAGGERAVVELVMATHAGMTTEEFEATVTSWLSTAKHPRFGRPYTELVYHPMLELLAYLRASGFKTYVVSGGGGGGRSGSAARAPGPAAAAMRSDPAMASRRVYRGCMVRSPPGHFCSEHAMPVPRR